VDVTNGYLKVKLVRVYPTPNLLPYVAILDSSGRVLQVGALETRVPGSSVAEADLPNGRYYVEVSGAGLPGAFSSYGSLGYYQLVLSKIDRPSIVGNTQLQPSGDRQLTASWGPATSRRNGPVTYVYRLCSTDLLNNCGESLSTSMTSVNILAPECSKYYVLLVDSVDQLGVPSELRLAGPATSSRCAPIAPIPEKVRYDESTRTVNVQLAGGQEFAPDLVTAYSLTYVNLSTRASIVQTVPASFRTISLSMPAGWENTEVTVMVRSQTASIAPWNVSVPSAVGSVFIGRRAAPPAESATTIPRVDAPQAGPGTTLPRTGAPQA
jgi:hypothetical protein